MNPKHYFLPALESVLQRHVPTTRVNSSTGTALITGYGARLIGLFPDQELPNTLWVHADIDSILKDSQWLIGGERLWISPESDYFYQDAANAKGHRVPPALDPGNYEPTGFLSYRNEFAITNTRTGQTHKHCTAEREFAPLADPYGTGLPYAGVSVRDSLHIEDAQVAMCCWSLTQVFSSGPERPGTALFPTKGFSTPVPYFRQIPKDRFDAVDGYARFKIDLADVYKFTIRPEDIDWDNPVKALYVSPYPTGDQWFCVVKRSNDVPKGQDDCVDTARDNPDGPKGAIQSWNAGLDDQKGGLTFGEIELQLNKGVAHDGATIAAGVHELLSYAGTRTQISQLARTLLKTSVLPRLY